jgi:tetratricopeptide (TPR) repeat protein
VADDAPALVQAHNVLGIVAGSRQHLERSLALAEMLNDRAGRIAALNNLALVYGATGENERAIQTAAAALELCVAQGDRHREAALHNNLADLLHAAGRSEQAMVHLKQAVAIFAEVGSAADPTQPEIWKLTEW